MRLTESRRHFLAGSLAAFAFRGNTFAAIEGLLYDADRGAPDDEAFWLRVRDLFDIDPAITVFNHAGLSPSPRAAREAIAEQTKRANTDPSLIIWRRQDHELDPIRKQLAALIGCETDELALTANATYGLQTAIMGVPMAAGDEIIATNHEYSRSLAAIDQRARRDSIKPVIIQLKAPIASAKEIAPQILEKVTPRTKLIVLSQLTFLTGARMPIREIANAVADRGIPVLMDAAHGIGLRPEKFDETGAAVYTACLHKWLMGPIGTGVFVVKRPWIEKIWPLHPADRSLERSIFKFEQTGTRAAAPFLAIQQSLDLHNMLGRERKSARLAYLRNRLAERIINERGVTNYSSLEVDQAMIAVGFEKVPSIQLAGWLLSEHKIHVTTVVRAGMDAIRISPNVFTSEAEIDRLATILTKVAREGV
jgi:isopenicillin-N epimerase